MYLFKTC